MRTDLKTAIRKALAGSTSQQPVDVKKLYPLDTIETVQAALMQMYDQREVMCCLITTRGVQKSVWWSTKALVELPRYGVEGARDAIMQALALPAPLGKLLIQYVALFRPDSRNIAFGRVATLLGELQPMIEAARIERSGRTWSAPIDYWKMALEEMIAKRDKLTLPLKSHGYLLEVIAGYSNKAEVRQEHQSENRRAGNTQTGATVPAFQPAKSTPQGPRSKMPASVKAALNPGEKHAQ